MKRIPQIRLRTIFLIFVCAAVGLTAGTSPVGVADNTSLGGIRRTPQLDWDYVLLASGSAALIPGLAQQVWLLLRGRLRAAANASDFALWFGIAWRVLIAALLLICLLSKISIVRGFASLPATDAILIFEPFPQVVWLTCLIVVLSVSAARWKTEKVERTARRPLVVAVWLVGIVLAAIVYSEITKIQFLIHTATAGVDSAIPDAVNRQGVYPNHRLEGFRTFWISFAATGCIMLAAASLVALNGRRRDGRGRWRLLIAFAVFVVAAAAYLVWYHAAEFHRISPDLASVGLAANWVELTGSAMLAGILVTVGAYRLTVRGNALTESSEALVEFDGAFVHESALVMAVLVGFVGIYAASMIMLYNDLLAVPWRSTSIGEVVLYVMQDVMIYFMIGLAVPAILVCWRRWRRRNEQVAWRLRPLDGRRFAWNWLALALVALVGIPTLSSFAFVMWLGPWWLVGT